MACLRPTARESATIGVVQKRPIFTPAQGQLAGRCRLPTCHIGARERSHAGDVGQPGQASGVGHDRGLLAARIADSAGDDEHRLGVLRRVVLLEDVEDLMRLRAGRQPPLVGKAELDAEKRCQERNKGTTAAPICTGQP